MEGYGNTMKRLLKLIMNGEIMEENKITFKSIDEYISKFPGEIQEILNKLRKVIKCLHLRFMEIWFILLLGKII